MCKALVGARQPLRNADQGQVDSAILLALGDQLFGRVSKF